MIFLETRAPIFLLHYPQDTTSEFQDHTVVKKAAIVETMKYKTS